MSNHEFKVGDKAIVVNVELPMMGYAKGDIVTVEGPSHAGLGRLRISKPFTDYGFCAPSSLKPVSKFRVGDIVKGANDHYLITNRNMTKAEVTGIGEDGEITIKALEFGNGGGMVGHEFYVDSDKFELVTEENEQKPKASETGAKWVRATQDGLDLTKGVRYKVVGLEDVDAFMIIDDNGDEQYVDLDEVEIVAERDIDRPTKGDLVQVTGSGWVSDGKHIIEGDDRSARIPYLIKGFWIYASDVELVTGPVVEKSENKTTKNDVVDYLRKLSAEEILDIVQEARDEDEAEIEMELF